MRRARIEEHPRVPELQWNLAGTLVSLTQIRLAAGAAARAEECGREALGLYRALVRREPDVTDYRGGLATCCSRPWLKIATRVDSASASDWSCVTKTKVVPVSS